MPCTPKRVAKRCGGPSLRDLRAQGIRPEDIDDIWLNEMVQRLFTELKRQLTKVENGSAETSTERAADARTLATLERTLERLVKLEAQRAASCERTSDTEGARAALERKIDRLAAGDASSETAP